MPNLFHWKVCHSNQIFARECNSKPCGYLKSYEWFYFLKHMWAYSHALYLIEYNLIQNTLTQSQ